MTVNLTQFLIVCPLVFIGGIVDAIAGGGGLITYPAYFFAGLPTHMAIGTNKISSFMGTSLTTAKYARDGFIPLKESIFGIAFAFAGSNLGAHIALLIDDRHFKILMLFIIPLAAFFVLKKKTFDAEREPFSPLKTIIIICLAAFFLGMYDGFYGPGTGTFLLLALTSLARLDIRKANGTTKAINLTTNISALIVYLRNDSTVVILGLVAGLFGIAGNYIGATFFEKQGARAVRPIMITVLILFFIKIVVELL